VGGDSDLYWGLGLVATCLLLIVLEVLIPSGGLIAIGSALAGIGGIVLLFMYDVTWGLTGLLFLILLSPVAFFGAINMLPHTPIGRQLLGEENEETKREREEAEQREKEERLALIGARGVASSDLHPVGEVEIQGKIYQALAEHTWIDADSSVEVVDTSGLDLHVKQA